MAVAVLFFTGAGAGTGSGEKEAAAEVRADRSLTVPEFEGFSLSAAVAEAGDPSWLRVSAADASSAFRPVTGTEADWRVCFQMPARGEMVRPSVRTLTLYAVPEREECPTQLLGTRRIGMPDLVGERFDDASSALGELGLARAVPFHAHTGKQLDGEARDLAAWQVSPAAAGNRHRSLDVDAGLPVADRPR